MLENNLIKKHPKKNRLWGRTTTEHFPFNVDGNTGTPLCLQLPPAKQSWVVVTGTACGHEIGSVHLGRCSRTPARSSWGQHLRPGKVLDSQARRGTELGQSSWSLGAGREGERWSKPTRRTNWVLFQPETHRPLQHCLNSVSSLFS